MRKPARDRMIYTGLILVCLIGFWWFENFYTPDSYSSPEAGVEPTVIPDFFLPDSPNGEVVHHRHFSLSYSEFHEQAEWVAYTLKKEHLTYDDRERPYFIEDPKVRTKSADWRNYRGSGYDRGHLCPAGDRRFSQQAYRETFYTSNISPQKSDFNAGVWNRLEMQVRTWCRRYGELYVVTGGVLKKGLGTIGEEDVSIPSHFYKIVARGKGRNLRALAFLMRHEERDAPLSSFLVAIDDLEELTGINFFEKLPDEQEGILEKRRTATAWKF